MWVNWVGSWGYDCSYFVGWVGSWVMIVVILWVGLGWVCMSVGWVWSWVMKMDPWTTLLYYIIEQAAVPVDCRSGV